MLRLLQLVKQFGKPVEGVDFPKKTLSIKGTSMGKKHKGAEEERRALFNTWLNAVVLMPDVLEYQETKVWLGLERPAKGSKFTSLEGDDDVDRGACQLIPACERLTFFSAAGTFANFSTGALVLNVFNVLRC